MKISVITMHNVKNYGSVLQCYATQTYFEKKGLEVEFIDYWRKNIQETYAVDKALTSPSMQKYSYIWNHIFLRSLVKIPLSFLVRKKSSTFKKFVKNNLKMSKLCYLDKESLKENPPIADIYCTGSDQVWNSIWNDGIEEPYFLDFVNKGKKLAFSASIGRERLDDYEIEPTKQFLQKYDLITMREDSGVKLLDEMGIKAIQILDPSLILNKEEWTKLLPKKNKTKKYILVYQLNDNEDFDNYVKKLSKFLKLDVIRLSYGIHDNVKYGTNIACPPVEDFLWYFYNADYVVTDSFHGTAFSLNFNKLFVNILPNRFSTRITSILNMTNLQERVVSDYEDMTLINKPINYEEVNNKLEDERKKIDLIIDDFLNSVKNEKKFNN